MYGSVVASYPQKVRKRLTFVDGDQLQTENSRVRNDVDEWKMLATGRKSKHPEEFQARREYAFSARARVLPLVCPVRVSVWFGDR